jgi:hypothetical protein
MKSSPIEFLLRLPSIVCGHSERSEESGPFEILRFAQDDRNRLSALEGIKTGRAILAAGLSTRIAQGAAHTDGRKEPKQWRENHANAGGARLCQAEKMPPTADSGDNAASSCASVLKPTGATSAIGAGFWAKNWQTEHSSSPSQCEAATPGRCCSSLPPSWWWNNADAETANK